MNHIVALSGGKDSTALALRLAEVEPRLYQFCITPTGRELPAMHEHWGKLACLLQSPIIRIPAPSLLDKIKAYQALPNFRMRWCTREIKIEPFIKYAASLAPATCYVGIRADEVQGDDARHGTDWNGIQGVSQDLPLVRWGWGISKVSQYLADRSIHIPDRTDCDCCFHQRISEWWRLWRDHPNRWQELEALEIWTGHTFRSEHRDSWPASLNGMRIMFEKGYLPNHAAQTHLPLNLSDRKTMCAWCAR